MDHLLEMSLTAEQYKNFVRFRKRLPKNAGAVRVYSLSNGTKVFQADVLASNIPGSFATYEKQVDATGKTVLYTKTTYAANGSIVHVKQKFP